MVGLQLAHTINFGIFYWNVGRYQPVRWIPVGSKSSWFCCRSSCIGRRCLVGGFLLGFFNLWWCGCMGRVSINTWTYCFCFSWFSLILVRVFGYVTSASASVSITVAFVQLCFECVESVDEVLYFCLGMLLVSICLWSLELICLSNGLIGLILSNYLLGFGLYMDLGFGLLTFVDFIEKSFNNVGLILVSIRFGSVIWPWLFVVDLSCSEVCLKVWTDLVGSRFIIPFLGWVCIDTFFCDNNFPILYQINSDTKMHSFFFCYWVKILCLYHNSFKMVSYRNKCELTL